jgi:hypothetical protein
MTMGGYLSMYAMEPEEGVEGKQANEEGGGRRS